MKKMAKLQNENFKSYYHNSKSSLSDSEGSSYETGSNSHQSMSNYNKKQNSDKTGTHTGSRFQSSYNPIITHNQNPIDRKELNNLSHSGKNQESNTRADDYKCPENFGTILVVFAALSIFSMFASLILSYMRK